MKDKQTKEDVINRKLEFIFGLNEIKEEDLIKVKSLLVELYEEKHGEIPILTL